MRREMCSPTPLLGSALSCELILSGGICCHAVFIFAHGGFGDILRMGDNYWIMLEMHS